MLLSERDSHSTQFSIETHVYVVINHVLIISAVLRSISCPANIGLRLQVRQTCVAIASLYGGWYHGQPSCHSISVHKRVGHVHMSQDYLVHVLLCYCALCFAHASMLRRSALRFRALLC